jgi:long-chain acyl-CoA synthetase
MNTSMVVGAYVILFAKPPPAEELLGTIERLPDYNGFIYCGAEILFQRISMLPDEVIKKYNVAGKLKVCISSAGPLHDYVRDPFEAKTGARIAESYGLTEASPGLSGNNLFGYRETGWLGVPMPGDDWAIFPANDEEFANGPIEGFGEEYTGEICATGPNIMKGYYNRETDELKEWNGQIWLQTGDIGFMDENGRIAIRDRKKQLIKMSGHSVFPREVEELLGQHPAILEVAVAGLPDQKLGEAVKAWVALKPESKGKVTPEEILQWASENLTQWKVPKYLDIIDEVPKNAIGKVQRRLLQEADPLWQTQAN